MSKSCPIENRQICLISAVMFSLFLVSITSAIWYALVKYDLMLDFRKCQVAAAAAEVVQGTSEPSLEPPSTPSSMMDTGMELNPMLEFDKIESWNRQQLEAYTNTMIHAINSNASNTWKAYFNDALTMVSDVWKIPDAIFSDEAIENLNLNGSFAKKNTTQEFYSKISEYESVPSSRLHFGAVTEELPENFDCREKWLHCSYMQQPTVNQGSCGSCWVVSTTSTLSDRICVASNMTVDVQLSAFDVLSCCNEYCSRNMYPGDLCSGGSAPWVLNHFSKVGIVTGGSYGSIDGCKPYGFDSSCGSPCTPGRYMQVHKSFQQKTPVCEKKCRNGYSKTYEEDLYKVVETRVPESVQEAMKQMQRELYERGPIVACFTVYEDFILYRSGIYRQLKGAVVYGHCVRVVGWGVENGVPYWTAANSWGRDWGENGFFRIVRGENHLEFEDFTLAATINITTTQ